MQHFITAYIIIIIIIIFIRQKHTIHKQ